MSRHKKTPVVRSGVFLQLGGTLLACFLIWKRRILLLRALVCTVLESLKLMTVLIVYLKETRAAPAAAEIIPPRQALPHFFRRKSQDPSA